MKPLLLTSVLCLTIAGCSSQNDTNIEQWQSNKKCNLHKEACSVTHGDQTVTLRIDPHPIPIARPLGIRVATDNISPQAIELDISGINMYMGYNRTSLQSTKPNFWVGTSMLAFCTSERMEWQLTLMLKDKDKQIQIPFYLETTNR
ncbi:MULTISPECIES: hypothetical protein [Thiomicrorhabdus]|uniref:Lipoprotein n=1 Tax=Thiomicrorhabdus heinhorstiae TaxID=2748010 RepID=A0ABS0BUZ2_9GAMM|nr:MULTISPECIES: hypothetical protein [Thiomicrorhabdus]MBF6057595.1 hypothetical protein [Thiomicrorhabdus heinhorstiae]